MQPMQPAAAPPLSEPPDPIRALIVERAYREATARAAREHGPAMGRLCMAMLGSQAEAEECVQEALLAAYDAMPDYRGEGTVRAWLFGIARRMCAKRLEVRGRRERRLRLVFDATADAARPDELVQAQREAARVREALEKLKPSERDALVMRYEGGLEYGEIALACGIDEAAARKRVSRGLQHLRELFTMEVGR